MFTSVDKAIVACFGVIVFFGGYFGVNLEWLGDYAEPVSAIATAALVYFVPNKVR